jgi:hypothetical protein
VQGKRLFHFFKLPSGLQIGDHGKVLSPSAHRKNCKVAEMTPTDRSTETGFQPSRFRVTQRHWTVVAGRIIVIVVLVIGSYSLGRHWRSREITDYSNKNMALQKDNQRLTKTNSEQAQQIKILRAQLEHVSTQLNEIFLPTRKLEIKANESKRLSAEQLIIGLIGTPGNESIDLNVNGKKYSVSAGSVTTLQLSTNCRIEIQSIDVLGSSAVVNTTCTAAKP